MLHGCKQRLAGTLWMTSFLLWTEIEMWMLIEKKGPGLNLPSPNICFISASCLLHWPYDWLGSSWRACKSSTQDQARKLSRKTSSYRQHWSWNQFGKFIFFELQTLIQNLKFSTLCFSSYFSNYEVRLRSSWKRPWDHSFSVTDYELSSWVIDSSSIIFRTFLWPFISFLAITALVPEYQNAYFYW